MIRARIALVALAAACAATLAWPQARRTEELMRK